MKERGWPAVNITPLPEIKIQAAAVQKHGRL